VELSRPFRGLRLWLPLQALGTAPFAASLEEKLLLARYGWELFRALDQVEVGPPPDLSIFFFRVLPRRGAPAAANEPAAIDALNFAMEKAFMEDGRVLFSSTVIGGRRYLRFAVLALATHREAIELAARLVAEKIGALT
jgi:glutamate/tyrosine decarboxylase-like PLP-dependent enzyme